MKSLTIRPDLPLEKSREHNHLRFQGGGDKGEVTHPILSPLWYSMESPHTTTKVVTVMFVFHFRLICLLLQTTNKTHTHTSKRFVYLSQVVTPPDNNQKVGQHYRGGRICGQVHLGRSGQVHFDPSSEPTLQQCHKTSLTFSGD